jgi:hypothetical protein
MGTADFDITLNVFKFSCEFKFTFATPYEIAEYVSWFETDFEISYS